MDTVKHLEVDVRWMWRRQKPVLCWWLCTMLQPLRKSAGQLPKEKDKCRIFWYLLISFDPTFYFRVYPQENSKPWTQAGVCSPVFMLSMLTADKGQKKTQALSADKQTSKMWTTHNTGMLFSHKKKEILAHALTSMNVEPITQSEMSQSQKNMLRMMSLL